MTSNLSTFNIYGRDITVGFWVKPTVTKSATQYLFQNSQFNLYLKPNSTDLGVDMGYSPSGSLLDGLADYTASLLQNQWNHVVVTMQSSTPTYNYTTRVNVYVNGTLKATGTRVYTCSTVSTARVARISRGAWTKRSSTTAR